MPTSTPTSSGRCAAAAATSASSPRSSFGFIRSDRRCWRAASSTRSTRGRRSLASTGVHSTAPEELTTYLAFATRPTATRSPPSSSATVVRSRLERRCWRRCAPSGPDRRHHRALPYTEVQAFGDPVVPARAAQLLEVELPQRTQRRGDPGDDRAVRGRAVATVGGGLRAPRRGGRQGGQDATAFGDRSAPYSLLITGEWEDPAETEGNIRWARDCWEAVRPFAKETVYVNYVDADEEDRVKGAYGGSYERLAALKDGTTTRPTSSATMSTSGP